LMMIMMLMIMLMGCASGFVLGGKTERVW